MGLGRVEALILFYVSQTVPQDCTMRHLRRTLQLNNASLGKAVNGLERKGYLCRVVTWSDRQAAHPAEAGTARHCSIKGSSMFCRTRRLGEKIPRPLGVCIERVDRPHKSQYASCPPWQGLPLLCGSARTDRYRWRTGPAEHHGAVCRGFYITGRGLSSYDKWLLTKKGRTLANGDIFAL